MKKMSHTSIFICPTGCGKTVLGIVEWYFYQHFNYIIILCPTLRWNKTYPRRSLLKRDDNAWLIGPKDKLFEWINALSKFLAGEETLFIIDDTIADESLDKCRQFLLERASSCWNQKHYLWLLKQSYSAIPRNLRLQGKSI